MRRERDTFFLCWLLLHRQLSTRPTRGARRAQSRLAWAQVWISPPPVRTQELNCFFLKSPNPQPTLPGMTSFTSLASFPIWEFYLDICEWRFLPARAWTPALMLHLTNPCAKRKVLSLTKPKGKIHKTKSLGNYITPVY